MTRYKYGFKDPENYVFRLTKGLSKEIVEEISWLKMEPEWMRKFRLNAYEIFLKKNLPSWGPDLSDLNFDDIVYYVKPSDRKSSSWEDVPEYIRNTFERLGIPEAERRLLAGLSAQYESEMVYHKLKESWKKKGVIFVDTDTAVKEYPELVREYIGTVVSPSDNKFSALNSAVWSGGSFIYIPEGVSVEIPLQAYFRINSQNMGQFERTLIIAEPGSYVHYIEGCTAPIYSTYSLHSAVVEVVVKKGARVRYTTIQNWSYNVYNLVTKRAVAYDEAIVEWIDGNLGSKVTMKYPSVYMRGKGSKAELLSIAYAGKGQFQDVGAKVLHLAPYTFSRITSKSISKDGGRNSYRGLVYVDPCATKSNVSLRCDTLLLDNQSRSDTYPIIKIENSNTSLSHEASVSKIDDEQLFYLESRGLPKDEASALIVRGFIEPISKELPFEYAVELNRLIRLQLRGDIG
ncbi:MAG: Fe-S cluster assembly protein SufB [bacterium]|nr:Fe-S cluster assembly protein SufB [bacterium]